MENIPKYKFFNLMFLLSHNFCLFLIIIILNFNIMCFNHVESIQYNWNTLITQYAHQQNAQRQHFYASNYNFKNPVSSTNTASTGFLNTIFQEHQQNQQQQQFETKIDPFRQQDDLDFNEQKRIVQIYYSPVDLHLIENFISKLKEMNNISVGYQRLIRLNAACTQKYLSLRQTSILANIPIDEAFKDPYTLIEQHIYKKLTTFKSTQTNKFLCFNPNTGNFYLKNVADIDKYCVFKQKINSNEHQFALGTNMVVYLAFNKHGKIINYYKQQKLLRSARNSVNINNQHFDRCNNYSTIFYVHIKIKDAEKELDLAWSSSLVESKTTSTSTTTTTTTTTTTKTPTTTTTKDNILRKIVLNKSKKKHRKMKPNKKHRFQTRKKLLPVQTMLPQQFQFQQQQQQQDNLQNYDELVYYYKDTNKKSETSTQRIITSKFINRVNYIRKLQ